LLPARGAAGLGGRGPAVPKGLLPALGAAGLGGMALGGVEVGRGGVGIATGGVCLDGISGDDGCGVDVARLSVSGALTSGALFFVAAFFAGAFFAGFDSLAGFATGGNFSRNLRTTGGSTVDEAERTNSPISWSLARTSLLSIPISFANS